MSFKKKLLVIINPISGVGKQRTIEKVLESHLDHSAYDYDISYTEYAHHSKEIAQEACFKGYDAIIAVGGDGSINDVVSGIVEAKSDVALGVIPCGSGNGLARHLQIPLAPKKAVELINTFNVEKIDTISINDRVYVSIAGIGFDALVANEFNLIKTRGLQGYTEVIVKEYPFYAPQTYRITVDDKEIERKALFISFANSNQFGFNAVVAPTASLSDGLIDVCIVDPIPLVHLPIIAQLVYTRHFDLSQHVEIIKAKNVEVHNNDYGWVNIDGEAVKMGNNLKISVNSKNLNIICPHGKKK